MPTNANAKSAPNLIKSGFCQIIPNETKQIRSPGIKGMIDGYKNNVDGFFLVIAKISLYKAAKKLASKQ